MAGTSWIAWARYLNRLLKYMIMPFIKVGFGLALLSMFVQFPVDSGARDYLAQMFSAGDTAARDQIWPLGTYAYVNQQDRNSETAIQLQASSIDYIIPDWYFLTASSCSIDSRIFPRVKNAAQDAQVGILPLFQNQDSNGVYLEQTKEVLNNEELRNCLSFELVKNAKNDEVNGAVIDFQVTDDMRDQFIVFLRELDELFAKNDLTLYIASTADNDGLGEMSEFCDYVIIKMNDQPNGSANSPASTEWIRLNLNKIKQEVPQEKLIFSIAQVGESVDKEGNSREMGFSEAAYTAKLSNLSFQKDSQSGAWLAQNQEQTIYLQDPRQAKEQLGLLSENGVKGIAVYRLGAEHPFTWQLVNNPAQAVPEKLDAPPYTHYVSRGEILTILSEPSPSADFPHGYILQRYGEELPKNSIFITFDDGPDPTWTPKIIDLLKTENVPATFFVLGSQVQNYPGVSRLLADPLFTVGNHTFSHPHLDQISNQEIRIESASTTRLIKDVTGENPRFFRMTFNVNTEPTHPEVIRGIDVVVSQGFAVVGADIDSRDWDNPDVDEAVASILNKVEKDMHIVVFHDGGGDRSATVSILEKLIPEARKRGYRFMNLNDF